MSHASAVRLTAIIGNQNASAHIAMLNITVKDIFFLRPAMYFVFASFSPKLTGRKAEWQISTQLAA